MGSEFLQSFLYIDCPDPSYLSSLTDKEIIKSDALEQSDMKLIVHVVGTGVWTDPGYQGWLKQFGREVYVGPLYTSSD